MSGNKIIAEEIIEEITDEPSTTAKPAKQAKRNENSVVSEPNKASTSISAAQSRIHTFSNLIKRKQQPLVVVKPKMSESVAPASSNETKTDSNKVCAGLSMLAAYSDSSEDSQG